VAIGPLPPHVPGPGVANAASMSVSRASRLRTVVPVRLAASWVSLSARAPLGIVRICHHRHSRVGRYDAAKQVKAFRAQIRGDGAEASDIATRPRNAGDETIPDGVGGEAENNRDARRRGRGSLSQQRSRGKDHVGLAPCQFGGHRREPLGMPLRGSKLQPHVLSNDVAERTQPSPNARWTVSLSGANSVVFVVSHPIRKVHPDTCASPGSGVTTTVSARRAKKLNSASLMGSSKRRGTRHRPYRAWTPNARGGLVY